MTQAPPAAPRTLAVCADDFGIAPGISSAIATLAGAGRLTATTCLVNGPHWPEAARALRALPRSVELGLHLNLTEGAPRSRQLAARWPAFPDVRRMIVLAQLGRLPRGELRDELDAQLAAFVAGVGRAPDFIDGHQHVHHLPVVRDLVLDLAEHIRPRPAVRSTARLLGRGSTVKRWVIERTGGRALGAELRRRGLPHNHALLGAYGFDRPDYGALVREWLAHVPADGALLFCHPGRALPSDPPDAIAAAREREFAYLGSAAFGDDLAAAGVALGPVWQVAAAQDAAERR